MPRPIDRPLPDRARRSPEAGGPPCSCPDPMRYPEWRAKACPVHGRRASAG